MARDQDLRGLPRLLTPGQPQPRNHARDQQEDEPQAHDRRSSRPGPDIATWLLIATDGIVGTHRLGPSLSDHFDRLPACTLSAGLPSGPYPAPDVQGCRALGAPAREHRAAPRRLTTPRCPAKAQVTIRIIFSSPTGRAHGCHRVTNRTFGMPISGGLPADDCLIPTAGSPHFARNLCAIREFGRKVSASGKAQLTHN